MFDVTNIRRDFPILQQTVHGKPLVYLDNAATTQKPKQVIQALVDYYQNDNANVHRGVHTLSERSTLQFEAARETVRAWLNAASAQEIVFTKGTTESINLVAQSYARSILKPGDEIVVSAMEHHSNLVPWQMVCEQTGAVLKVMDAEFNFSPHAKIVAVTHVSNALGMINPIAEIIEKAHQVGAVVLVDGAQAVAHMTVDVQALDCDFYAFSSHKAYGPTGIGVLYAKSKHLASMPPYQGGGEMIQSVTFEKSTYHVPPFRFEAGTPNIEGAIGLAAAIKYLSALDREAVKQHEELLLQHATERLKAVSGVRIIGEASAKASIVSFVMEGVHPHDIGTILDHQGVAVRTGHHCAMPLMERLGVPGTARASFALYNTLDEVDALVDGLQQVKKLFV